MTTTDEIPPDKRAPALLREKLEDVINEHQHEWPCTYYEVMGVLAHMIISYGHDTIPHSSRDLDQD